jgi:predicted lactoylglutathione lyase
MSKKQIFINLPVKDLMKSTAFYEALGFTKNQMFSNDTTGNALQWSEDIVVMLLSHDFYKTFINSKEVADSTKTSEVALCINFDSKEEVDTFAEAAKANGGNHYKAIVPGTEVFMYSYEVEDLDGHLWEPLYMDTSKFPGPNQ